MVSFPQGERPVEDSDLDGWVTIKMGIQEVG